MRKLLTVIGARPQFIKAAMLSRAIQADEGWDEIIVHTGQHYDAAMSNVFFEQMGIPKPGHKLDISGGNHGDMTGRMMCALEPIMCAEKPTAVLVYGDTNSTLAGAVTASKLHIPVVHIEAGLRSYNRRMPEEINRVLTDHVSSLLFCPNEQSIENLGSEGIFDDVHNVGDIMFDAALHFSDYSGAFHSDELLAQLSSGEFVLATVHRQENTDDEVKLRRIVEGLVKLSESCPVVFPMHPRTRSRVASMGIESAFSRENLHLIEPLGYLEMLRFERRSGLIVTDSGGVQKEAYFFRVPCLTLRDETEWTELVDMGWNQLVNVLSDDIAGVAMTTIGKVGDDGNSPYGTGNTANRIVRKLGEVFSR